ncbi:MAG TPA: hypothetical protein DEA08_27405, partial [Planctomycetes bacterium]|nr:hypothetical protein [Planctomycetota bacterium]
MTPAPHLRATALALLLPLLASAPLRAAEHLDREPLRATILDRTCLDRVSVDPLRGALSYARRDLVLGEGPDRLVLERRWAPDLVGSCGAGWSTVLDARLELDERGQPFLFQDESGVLQLLEPHADGWRTRFGRVLRVEAAEGGWRLLGRRRGEEWRFGAEGRLRECRRFGHLAWTLSRDQQGRVSRARGAWGELKLVYAEGRLLEVRGPGLALRYAYEQGRLVEAARGERFARYGYDAEGRLNRLARGQGRFRYDEAGRVTGIANSGLAGERYAYRREGQTLHVERTRRGERTRWQVGETRIVTVLPTGGAELVELDARGRPLRRVRGDLRWAWRYDEQGRLVARETPQGSWRLGRFQDFAWGSEAPREVTLPSG